MSCEHQAVWASTTVQWCSRCGAIKSRDDWVVPTRVADLERQLEELGDTLVEIGPSDRRRLERRIEELEAELAKASTVPPAPRHGDGLCRKWVAQDEQCKQPAGHVGTCG